MIKKILIFTMTEGHLSLAQALKEIFMCHGYQTEISDPLSKKGFTLSSYTPVYRYLPFLFKVPYKLSEQQTILKATQTVFGKWLEKAIKNEIKTHQPDLIISTYLFYNPAIEKVLDYQKTAIPFINLVANPWTIHPLEVSLKANLNLVYDKKGIQLIKKYHLPTEKIIQTGWFVRQSFYQKQNLAKLRKSLDFKKNIFTLLICGGSEGTNMILKIMPALLASKKPLQVIVVCGTNKTLYKALESLQKIISRVNRVKGLNSLSKKIKLKVIQFTNLLPQYISLCDLVIGKAGPNLIFETVAGQKPFFGICHISGQEDGNLPLIKKKGLGLVEENPFKAIKIIQNIIAKPEFLQKFQPNLKKEKLYNQQAEAKLINLIKSFS